MGMGDDAEDPWATARESLASAGSQAAAAAVAMASVVASLIRALCAAAAATATSAYRAIEPPVKELAQSISAGTATIFATIMAHPDLVPATLMFCFTFVILFLSSCCCGRIVRALPPTGLYCFRPSPWREPPRAVATYDDAETRARYQSSDCAKRDPWPRAGLHCP